MARKVLKRSNRNGVLEVVFTCPGCEFDHLIPYKRPEVGYDSTGPCWGFNNSEESPTLNPSILVRSGPHETPEVCHSFVTDGNIQFLTDCTHKLAGQTVPLREVDEDLIGFWGN